MGRPPVARARFHDLVVTRWSARYRGRRFACAIGRGGVTTDKREGDGATPVGVMRLVGGGFRPDRLARPVASGLALSPIRPADIWSDDPEDPDYNRGRADRACGHSHERLRRADRNYDIVVATNWNWPVATPGRGSAIFVHLWKAPRRPTAGCVAFARPDLIWIIRRWTPQSRLIVRP